MSAQQSKMAEENIYECEVRILKKDRATGEKYHDWKIVPVRDAIIDEVAKNDVRCKGCHGRVKLLNKYGDVGNAPHAVHHSRQDSSYCELGFYFRQAKDGRKPHLSNMAVQ
jgi:predicted HNH restriction endonuclease